jgi:hypothetical protein
MPVSLQDLLDALELLDVQQGLGEAYLCRRTGKIYHHTEYGDLQELNDELPDDIGDEEKYLPIPDKKDLDLGKTLVLDFVREHLPGDFDEARTIFSKRGAYQKFKALLVRRNARERWYDYEAEATKQALRDWCEVNGVDLTESG